MLPVCMGQSANIGNGRIVIRDDAMNTFDLQEAARFLGIHPHTLQARAKAGIIPGAKLGKEWRFIDDDLVGYLRSQYPANQPRVVAPARSAHGVKHRAKARLSVNEEFERALNLPTRKRKSG